MKFDWADSSSKEYIMSFYQWFLPIFSAIYFTQVFVIRSYAQWKRTGKTPFVFGKKESAHDYIGFIFKLMSFATCLYIITYSFFENFYLNLLPINYLDYEVLRIFGTALACTSLIWIIIAQYQMADSWRIGIDQSEKIEFVRKGFFSISRNPVFLGVQLIYVSFFFITPNLVTTTLVVLSYFLLGIQIRLEEEYLENKHEENYIEYKKTVRRWI